MVVDTSALIAVLFAEPDAPIFLAKIAAAGSVRISAATVVELSIVAIGRKGAEMEAEVDLLLARSGAEIIALDASQVALARRAFLAFGKGRHEAKLNFGDCFSYALAKATGEPLLYKGEDFAKTDVVSAL